MLCSLEHTLYVFSDYKRTRWVISNLIHLDFLALLKTKWLRMQIQDSNYFTAIPEPLILNSFVSLLKLLLSSTSLTRCPEDRCELLGIVDGYSKTLGSKVVLVYLSQLFSEFQLVNPLFSLHGYQKGLCNFLAEKNFQDWNVGWYLFPCFDAF